MSKLSPVGADLVEALTEAVAWKRGEVALETYEVDATSADQIRAVRKRLARSRSDFARRFHIPVRTLEGWEQNRRKPNLTARLLLKVIGHSPDAVERALAGLSAAATDRGSG